MQIQAYAAMAAGASLQPFAYTAETEALGPYDCVVEVKACGVCHSDLHLIDDDWSRTTFPLVPGHEIVGEVAAAGAQVKHLKVGDRVGVGWQRGACLECSDCLHGNENLCKDNQPLIIGGHGGFASHVVVDARFAFAMPDGVETSHGGPLLCGGITVYSGLLHAGMRGGQEIGVIGVGGLGHMAIQFAHKLGNRVTAYTTSDDKAQFASQLGADDVVIVPKGEPPPRPKRRLDILLSTVPAALDWAGYLGHLGTDGVLSLVGIPDEPITLPAFHLLAKRRRIMASPIGGRAEMVDMLRIADSFGVQPIVETFPMDQLNAAIAKVRSNAIRYRAVLLA